MPRPVLPQRTFSSAYKKKKQLFCFLIRRTALTALSMKIRRPSKSQIVASRFSDDSMIGKLLLGNFSLGQAMFRIVWRVQSSSLSFPHCCWQDHQREVLRWWTGCPKPLWKTEVSITEWLELHHTAYGWTKARWEKGSMKKVLLSCSLLIDASHLSVPLWKALSGQWMCFWNATC